MSWGQQYCNKEDFKMGWKSSIIVCHMVSGISHTYPDLSGNFWSKCDVDQYVERPCAYTARRLQRDDHMKWAWAWRWSRFQQMQQKLVKCWFGQKLTKYYKHFQSVIDSTVAIGQSFRGLGHSLLGFLELSSARQNLVPKRQILS